MEHNETIEVRTDASGYLYRRACCCGNRGVWVREVERVRAECPRRAA